MSTEGYFSKFTALLTTFGYKYTTKAKNCRTPSEISRLFLPFTSPPIVNMSLTRKEANVCKSIKLIICKICTLLCYTKPGGYRLFLIDDVHAYISQRTTGVPGFF